MASRKPSRRRTHLGFERLDDRVTPAVFFSPGNSALSALTGAAFSAPSSATFPGLGSAGAFFPSLTANTGATTGFGTTTATQTPGFGFGAQGNPGIFGTPQPSATAGVAPVTAGQFGGSSALGNLTAVLGATQTSRIVGFNPASNTFSIPGVGVTASTFTSPINPTVNAGQVVTTAPTSQGITPAFTTAFLGGGNSLPGNSGLSFLGNTGLTTPGSGLGLGGLTNSGLSLASGLGAFPTTFLTGLTTSLTPTIPGAITTGSVLPVAAPLAPFPATLSAFGASTRPAGFFLTGLSPMIQATTAAQGALRSVTPASIVTPVAAPTTTVTTATTPFQTTATLSNTVPLTVTPTIGNVAAVTAALASMGVTPQRIAPFTNAISFNAPLSFLPQVATL